MDWLSKAGFYAIVTLVGNRLILKGKYIVLAFRVNAGLLIVANVDFAGTMWWYQNFHVKLVVDLFIVNLALVSHI